MWIDLQLKEVQLNASKLFVALATLLFAVASVVLFLHGKLTLQIAMAEEQIQIFDLMRTKALAASPREASECLEYVQNYYPSGTKQKVGSRLDKIVELARAASTREIITYLQIKTGKDFGNNLSK